MSIKDDKGSPLKLEEVSKLAESEEIQDAAPVAQSTAAARSSYAEETVSVYGTTGAYAQIKEMELYAGRFLKGTDVENHTNVAVINAGLALEVMGRMDVVGEELALGGMEYQIVGVLKAESSDTSTIENFEAYVPYTSLIRMVQDVPYEVTRFIVSASSEKTMDKAEAELEERMLGRFSQDEDAFSIINQSAVMEAMESVNKTLALLLGGIACSWGALKVISAVGDGGADYALSMGVVWIAVAFSAGIGVLFGIYPANKAAKKKPIEALRYTG